MKNVSFYIKELAINRMPGFNRGISSLKLAKNINLITGPNASGKSSTSRIIQQIIWPHKTRGLDVQALLEIDNKPWQVNIESEAVKIQEDGIDKKITGIPGKEGCHRYLLPLHDLIKEDEDDLAREIMKESIGGYDLDDAKSKLNYSRTIKNSAASEYREVNNKETKLQEVLKNHKELKNEEVRLRNLRMEEEKARKASALSKFYKAVSEFLIVKQACKNLVSQKDQFPSSMDNVYREDLDTIDKLETELANAHQNIEIAAAKIEEKQQLINELQISGVEIPATTLSNLENRLQNAKNLTHKVADLEAQLLAKHQERCEAVKAIDETLDPLEWQRLNLEIIENLDEFTQSAYKVLGTKVNLEEEKNRLQQQLREVEDVSSDPEGILQGIKCLGSWIKEQETGVDMPSWFIPTLAISGILTAVATFVFGWPGLVGILFIVGLAIYELKTKKYSSSNSLRIKDFKDLKLPPPSGWNIEDVTDHIDKLLILLRRTNQKEETALKIRQLDLEHERLTPELNNIYEEHRKWREEIGSAPKIKENDFSSLYWFVRNARDWQKAHAAYKSLEGQKTAHEQQFQDELNELNLLLIKCNLQSANNIIEAEAQLKHLKEQLDTKKDCETNIGNQQVQLNGYKRNKKEISEKLQAIYKRLIVPEGDKPAVQRLIDTLDDYRRICQNLFAAEQKLVEKENDLKSHALYTELQDNVENISLEEAKEKALENENIATRLEEISGEITRINTLIKEKKKGHELEDLLTEKQTALDGLQNLCQTNIASITGDLIIEQLKTETREQNRPEVFKRANVLFNKITNGRYELRLDENDHPTFRAFDTVLKQGLDLNEVSTGTRVQLLLAVRLAYVESQEMGLKLPILADELLANSDDERAAAIIKALIEISKEGRQVFYFTAQADEVYKWESLLKEESEVEYNVVMLKDHRNQSQEQYPPIGKFSFGEKIPEPGSTSHADYGKTLNVEHFNPLLQDSAQLHLWYLIDDSELLFKSLSSGLKTWGQFESYRRLDGKIEGLTSEGVVKMESKIKLLDRLIYLSRKGQCIPIDREVLENSGAVTANFINEVCEKLKELNGDPKALLNALENSEVNKFRSNNIEKLRNYFFEQQILSEEEPLTQNEITTQLSAIISKLELTPNEAEDFCNQFLKDEELGFTEEESIE